MKELLRKILGLRIRQKISKARREIHLFKNRMIWHWQRLTVRVHYPEITRGLPLAPQSDKKHLKATMDWLCAAQDVTGCGGVSAWYDLSTKKWRIPYRETTGYIIETFLDYYLLTSNKEYLDRAEVAGDWEIEVMATDGGVGEPQPNGEIGYKIFNAGQVILGLCALYKVTQKEKYLTASKKIADWIVQNQDEDGGWSKFSNKGPKTIDSRVAWSLLLVYKYIKDEKYRDAARKNIDWTIGQQHENYWFSNMSLMRNREPWTHTISYTIEGLMESYLLGERNQKIYESFYGAAKKMLGCLHKSKTSHGFLPCSFNDNWESQDDYSCLTGSAQLAIVWMKIYKLTGEKEFLNGAHELIEQVKSTQILETSREEIRGGVLASYPFDGNYSSFQMINWAPKFFADALILKNKIK